MTAIRSEGNPYKAIRSDHLTTSLYTAPHLGGEPYVLTADKTSQALPQKFGEEQ